MNDPYKVLGVETDADITVIKKAYRSKAKQYHPDLNPGDEKAAEKFKELSEAYDILQDPEKRKLYDTYGASAFEQGGMGASGYGGFGFDMNDIFGDLFSDLFGGSSGRQNYNGPMQGADIRIEQRLTFKEAVFGVKKTVSVRRETECDHCHGTGSEPGTGKRTCPTCGGSGVVRHQVNTPFGRMMQQSTCSTCGGTGEIIEKPCSVCHGSGRKREQVSIDISIPAGVDNGNILPIRGEGHRGKNGGAAGDLFIVLRVAPSEIFERHGTDLYLNIPISFPQAALGDEIEVPTLYGNSSLKIPEGTQTGSRFPLKGKGVPDVRTQKPGNLYVDVTIETPKKLTEAQKHKLEAYSEAMGEEVEGAQKSFWDKVKDLFD